MHFLEIRATKKNKNTLSHTPIKPNSHHYSHTPPKINIEPENDGVGKMIFLFLGEYCQVPCWSSGVYVPSFSKRVTTCYFFPMNGAFQI